MVKVTGRLENWVCRIHTPTGEGVYFGYVYDDTEKRFPDGAFIHTSGTFDIMGDKGDIIKTRNSTYLLGERKDE